MISIICPIYNEEKYMATCIDSILQQDYPKEEMEVLFVDGMSTDKTREIIIGYSMKYPFIRMLDNKRRIVPSALNIGIRASKGELIIRLDAHAVYPLCYFSELVRQFNLLQADNIGGICRTLPVDNTAVCKAIAIALSSPFGMGNSYFRVGTKDVKKVDTVPFGCFKRDLFDKIGYFDEELIRNQDDEFNGRIIRNGGSIFLLPGLIVDYYARDTVSKVAKMFYQYGLFKPLVNKKLGSPATIRQFFPFLFVLGLIVGGIASCFSSVLLILYVSVLLLYLILAFAFSVKGCGEWKLIPILMGVFFSVHISYGWGYLSGIYKLCLKRNFAAKVNR